jgi:hypothetical protein
MMPGRLAMADTGCKGRAAESAEGPSTFQFVTHLFSGNVGSQPTLGCALPENPKDAPREHHRRLAAANSI